MSSVESGLSQKEGDAPDSLSDTGGLGGHPSGLTTLFFTEMWERFSYYGMRAILILYMAAPPALGGLGFTTQASAEIYGSYTMAVYLGAIPGGFISDRFLGNRNAILLGGIIIALGHFCLAFRSLSCFYGGLLLIVLGTGLLKPNMSTMVGKLYSINDHRRDAGFSIYYMGINLGAFLAPLVCGYLAQDEHFKSFLESLHFDARDSWHWGFGAAGVGMTFGLIQFLLQSKRLGSIGAIPVKVRSAGAAETDAQSNNNSKAAHEVEALSSRDWLKLAALAVLFSFTVLFWTVYEQGGSSLNLFADKLTECVLFGIKFPSSWFQALQPLMVIFLAPVFSWLWMRLGEREPSSPAKFVWGLALLAAGTAVMVPASMLAGDGKVGVVWLTSCYLLQTLGELCLSPVGLSTVTKLAPRKIAAMIMGFWFLANAIANKVAGYLAGFFNENDVSSLVGLYGGMATAAAAGALILVFLTPSVRKLMGDVK